MKTRGFEIERRLVRKGMLVACSSSHAREEERERTRSTEPEEERQSRKEFGEDLSTCLAFPKFDPESSLPRIPSSSSFLPSRGSVTSLPAPRSFIHVCLAACLPGTKATFSAKTKEKRVGCLFPNCVTNLRGRIRRGSKHSTRKIFEEGKEESQV